MINHCFTEPGTSEDYYKLQWSYHVTLHDLLENCLLQTYYEIASGGFMSVHFMTDSKTKLIIL